MNAPAFSERRAFDPLLRLIHAWNALAIVGLGLSAQLAEAFEHGPWEDVIWRSHVQFGYALVGGLALRLVWGLVGPEFARWADLWHPRAWSQVLRGRFAIPPRFGHDAKASAAFLALYAVLLLMAATGLPLAAVEFGMGPFAGVLDESSGLKHLLKEPHEAGFALVLGFIALHLGALAYHRFVLGAPVGQAMVTGMQRLPQETNHA
ncbi:MAG TPA: cytochrome b/b6 domain-containing protein [Rhodocyclaceae bacterium]